MTTRPLGLAERLEIDSILEDAYAPLRARRAQLSPLRVRAAVRWGRGAPAPAVGWSRTVSRLSELSVAVGMSVMVFVAALGSGAIERRDDPGDRGAAPAGTSTIDEQREMRAQRTEWYESLRASASRLRPDRSVPLQDRLDPSVVHGGPARAQRIEPPAMPAPTAPNAPY